MAEVMVAPRSSDPALLLLAGELELSWLSNRTSWLPMALCTRNASALIVDVRATQSPSFSPNCLAVLSLFLSVASRKSETVGRCHFFLCGMPRRFLRAKSVIVSVRMVDARHVLARWPGHGNTSNQVCVRDFLRSWDSEFGTGFYSREFCTTDRTNGATPLQKCDRDPASAQSRLVGIRAMCHHRQSTRESSCMVAHPVPCSWHQSCEQSNWETNLPLDRGSYNSRMPGLWRLAKAQQRTRCLELMELPYFYGTDEQRNRATRLWQQIL